MRTSLHALLAAASAAAPLASAQTRSAKRGLVFVPNVTTPEDDAIWVQPGSDLTWYYNYGSAPSAAFSAQPQAAFEFVPMLWGAVDDTSFLDEVTALIDDADNGVAVSHVLGFNEPDGPYEWGGSDIAPATAAEVWLRNIAPLAERGVKLGLPACTGGTGGIPWLQQFLANCSQQISANSSVQQNCTYDFVNIHWYGNFEGLASHMGEYSAAPVASSVCSFPNVPQWITEYNYADESLADTQSFYNTSSEYFDRLDSVGRYSMFGAFRADVSNVGPNAAMLSDGGELTDIGSWYLGGSATGVLPQSDADADDDTAAAARSQSHVSLTTTALAALAAGFFHL
ncbi:glycoside hydrolase family 128 protein [Xylariaceae sp. FL0804]|nr:glycoside hydrolase family 128 protein [Xylariaceae sp. FL0804]